LRIERVFGSVRFYGSWVHLGTSSFRTSVEVGHERQTERSVYETLRCTSSSNLRLKAKRILPPLLLLIVPFVSRLLSAHHQSLSASSISKKRENKTYLNSTSATPSHPPLANSSAPCASLPASPPSRNFLRKLQYFTDRL
jgi:hypothetical protein